MQKRIEYGFAEIRIGDEVFELVPNFFNIGKIGTPSQIVQKMYDISYRGFLFIRAFESACDILQACGLPEKLTGHLHFSERKGKMLAKEGLLPIEHVFLLAEHCMLHGIIGDVDTDDKDKERTGDPLTEFNVHSYLVDAVEFLGVDMDYAEQMTMTQFVKLVKAKNENMASRDPNNTANKQKDMQKAEEWYNEKAKKLNKNKPKEIKDPLAFLQQASEKAKTRGNK